MEEQQKNIDDIFRQSLGDYREVPPAAAWDKVAAKLDGDDNRRRGAFQRWPWTMMVLLLFVGGAWFALTLYGKWTRADHSAENAVAHTNTRTEGRKTSSPGTTPIASDPAKAAADRNELPGNEANLAIASASGNLSTATSDLSDDKPAQAIPVVATPSQYSGKPTRIIRSKTAAKASVSHNSLTSTPSTTNTTTENSPADASYAKVIADGAARENAPLATIRPRNKKTTVYGKMIVTEEIPENVFEADLAAITKTSVGTRTTAAQKNTAAPEQELPAKEPIVSTAPKAQQQPPVVQKAPINQSNTSLEQAPVTSPLKKNAATAKATPAADSAKTGKAVPPVVAASATASSPTKSQKETVAPKNAAQKPATATTATTASKQAPSAKEKPTSDPAKTGKADAPVVAATVTASAPTKSQKETVVPKSSAQKPATATTTAATTKQAPVAKEKSAADPANGKLTNSNGKAPVVAAIAPATSKPAPTSTKKQTKAAGQESASGTTATVSKAATASAPEKKAAQAPNEPPAPTLASASGMIPASTTPKPQPRARSTDALIAASAPPSAPAPKDAPASSTPADSATEAPKPKYPMSMSIAALVGYEFGMQTPAPGRIAAGARLLMHVSPKASIGLQPSIRYGTVASQKLTDEKVYQNSVINVDRFTSLAFSPSVRNSVDTLYHYVVRETFDSIVVGSTTAGGKSFEFELPLIVNYQINKAWHVYGGPSLNFGGKLTTTDPSIQKFTVTRKDSLVQSVRMPESEFVNYFGKSSLEPYSNYQPSSARLQDPASVRFGYIFGFGYDWKRFMFDASMHQQVSGYSNVAEPFQKVYSSPYLRLNLGYMLFPTKKSQKNDME